MKNTIAKIKYMKADEAAEYLRLSVSSLYRYCQSGYIKYIQLEGGKRFTRKDLDRFCDERTVQVTK